MKVAREMKDQAAYSPFFHSCGQEGVQNAERRDLNRRPTKLVYKGKIDPTGLPDFQRGLGIMKFFCHLRSSILAAYRYCSKINLQTTL